MKRCVLFFLTTITRFIHALERIFDQVKYSRSGGSPITIQPYRGFGTLNKLYIKGRVLEGKLGSPAGKDDNLWKNLVNSFYRFESDEIPFARLRVRCAGTEKEIQANEEGYFETWLGLDQPPSTEARSLTVELLLLEPNRHGYKPVHTEGSAVLPSPGCLLGIISDIDDTIVQTNVSNPFRTIWNLISSNAHTRRPIRGMAAFFRGLSNGSTVGEYNPVFYVSTSPWNIYDVLENFLLFQDFPPNPVLYLRDWGITQEELLPLEHEEHKIGFIKQVLDLYPFIRFILIGDSSLQDPEIYARIASDHPGRILAIYLLETTKNPERISEMHHLRARLARKNVPVILSNNVLPMAEHAASQGWISMICLEEVKHQVNL